MQYRYSVWALWVLATLAILTPRPAAGSGSVAVERAPAKARLSELIRTQRPDGAFRFDEIDAVLRTHPLFATIGLEIYKSDRDVGFLKQLQPAAAAYASAVLSRYDHDGDFLIELSSSTQTASVEDVGYNSLFALDLLSLTRLCIEMNQHVDAMFWYQGARTVSDRVIEATYDNRSRFFFPFDNAQGKRLRGTYALSAMPVYFDNGLGDDINRGIMANYILKNQRLFPEVPFGYLDGTAADRQPGAESSLRSLLLLGALARRGYAEEAKTFAATLAERERRDKRDKRGDAGKPYDRYFTGIIRAGDSGSFIPHALELDMFAAVGRMYGVLDLDGRRKLDRDIAAIRSFIDQPDNDPVDPAPVLTAMRGVYVTISAMRDEARKRKLFNTRDRQQIPGFDIYATFDMLVEDVIGTLRQVETRISTQQATSRGVVVNAHLANNSVSVGQSVSVRVTLSAIRGNPAVKSVTLYLKQGRETLLEEGTPIELDPGGAATEYGFQFSVANAVEGTLQPVRFSIETQLEGGHRLRHHFYRSVYINRPMTFDVAFPRGSILRDGTVPIEADIEKHVNQQYVLNAEWFSPAGLVLQEGSSFEMTMPADRTDARLSVNVAVPSGIRPGTFPYILKLYGDGVEQGVVTGHMFRHYQWLFVGPFAAPEGALGKVYPPEQGVNLRASYQGAIRKVSWMALPESSYRDHGMLDLTPMIPQVSTAYLYTVIKTQWPKETTISFESTSPAVIFVNGAQVLRLEESTMGQRERIPVSLAEGMNSVLIKLHSADEKRVYFQLGDEEDLTVDEFSNNLAALVDGYSDLVARATGQYNDIAQQIVTLTYSNPRAKAVSVIGSFNGWSPISSGMRRNDQGEWQLSLHLLPGRYTYRFLLDDNNHVLDPRSTMREPDGYGGENSVLVVR
jgi:hypothetical protein